MKNRVKQFIEREALLSKDARHLVAVSGGADSVCLLLMLKELGYDVEAVHCNFNLRGEESLRDENFVKELCQKNDIKLHLTHFDTRTYAELHKVSIEMAARQLRYRYFEQLRMDIGAADICVAHHQDDSVETILMNLLRGTGIHGLQGIQPRRGHIVRPLLCLSRHDIEQWLQERGQAYVTDSTNLVPDVVRNQLRLNVIPELQKVSPAFSANILATARRLGEAARVYDHAIGESLQRLVHHVPSDNCREFSLSNSDSNTVICIDELLREPSPESVLYEWLTPAGFSPATIEAIWQTMISSGKSDENLCAAAPLPCRGGVGGGVWTRLLPLGSSNNFLADRGLLSPPSTPPLEGRGAAALSSSTEREGRSRLMDKDVFPSGREWRSATHWLVSHRGSLLLTPVPDKESDSSHSSPLRIPEPGTYVCDDHTKLRITIADGPVIRRDPTVCCADADKVAFPLTLRPWQMGDRFCPLGMKGSKLVSDYLTDRHISLIDKRRQMVLCTADGTILWLVGQRPDHRFRITPVTRRTVIIENSAGSLRR